jgi:hypothetical protein
MPTSKSADHPLPDAVAVDAAPARPSREEQLRIRADALCRTAAECCRQHARHARLVRVDATAPEQRAACKVISLYDGLLAEMAGAYARVAARGNGNDGDDAWWHQANQLLHAGREYLRHQSRCNSASRGIEARSPDELEELQVEYELGASALLALQQAVGGYRKLRPETTAAGSPWPP